MYWIREGIQKEGFYFVHAISYFCGMLKERGDVMAAGSPLREEPVNTGNGWHHTGEGEESIKKQERKRPLQC